MNSELVEFIRKLEEVRAGSAVKFFRQCSNKSRFQDNLLCYSSYPWLAINVCLRWGSTEEGVEYWDTLYDALVET